MSARAPIHLGVNVDHVATLRQARGSRYPDPVTAALIAEQAGADSITIHLREDRRHIQDRDLEVLGRMIQTRINLEMAVTDPMLEIAARAAPTDCCFVPERRAELTTEGGLDVAGQAKKIAGACARLRERGIRVSLFVDPDFAQLDASAAAGAPVVELHTGAYAEAAGAAAARELERLRAAAVRAAIARPHGACGARAELLTTLRRSRRSPRSSSSTSATRSSRRPCSTASRARSRK